MTDAASGTLCVLGATGSVGGAALAAAAREDMPAHCLVAGENADRMRDLCLRHRPRRAVMRDPAAADRLRGMLEGEGVEIDGGDDAVREAAGAHDTVVAAIVGGDGLPPVLEAAKKGRRILLANKESLVVGGALLMEAARAHGASILPIDSEHAALFDLLAGGRRWTKLWLTASGGALRDMPIADLERATPAQVLAHPTWQMGPKITVDSATMMNKALEILEAAALFGATPQDIGVVLHPQSIVHAMVEEADGALVAQMAAPDMRHPISRMLRHPEPPRSGAGGGRLDWAALSEIRFAEPDAARYPCLALAAAAWNAGGAAAAALSVANDEAVARFLSGRVKFTDIARINEESLRRFGGMPAGSLSDLHAACGEARSWARAA